MRSDPTLVSLAAFISVVFTSIAFVILSTDPALAAEALSTEETKQKAGEDCACNAAKPSTRPKFADLSPEPTLPPKPPKKFALTAMDRSAALESVQFGLTELSDGSSLVWHRPHGQLSGIIRPTASFKDAAGKVCRHVVIWLSSGELLRKTEAIACRLKSGIWELDG